MSQQEQYTEPDTEAVNSAIVTEITNTYAFCTVTCFYGKRAVLSLPSKAVDNLKENIYEDWDASNGQNGLLKCTVLYFALV